LVWQQIEEHRSNIKPQTIPLLKTFR